MYNISFSKLHKNEGLSCKSIIYLLAFFFTLHMTPATYVTSSFLSQFIKESNVGYLYAIASFVTVIIFLIIRPILKKFGNYKTFLIVLIIESLMLSVLLLPNLNSTIVTTVFIVSFIMHALSFFHLDIFLEHYSSDNDTGIIRSSFLTAQNIAFIIGPLVAGLLLTNQDYWKIFLFGLIFMFPTIFIAVKYMRTFKDPDYKEPDLFRTALNVLKNKNLFSIVNTQALLRVFYAWMIIYTPIFLSNYIGFQISEVAFIIGIALVAFLILEPPLGYIADKVFGEKEALVLGFVIMAISTSAMSFVDIKNFWLWVFILFMTRVGASMVELMSESYFFKKIDDKNLNMMSLFRMIRPVTYVIFPALASVLLYFIEIKYLFLILGIFMLYGIKHSLSIKDTL